MEKFSQDYIDGKRDALARARAQWIKNGREMTPVEVMAFSLGFAEGRISGSEAMKKIALGTFALLLLFVGPAQAMTGAQLDALCPVIEAAESSNNPHDVGDHGKARGLMQIQKATWESITSWPWDDAFDGSKNVQVGRQVIERINEAYLARGIDPDKAHVVYSYNTGRYAWGALPAWTKNHPNKIYREIFN
jgi:hypothetical protein